MALPYPADRFDAAAMALVIFFVPDPTKAIDEMARVVRPGDMVATYMLGHAGRRISARAIRVELRAMGLTPPSRAPVNASRTDALRDLWTGAGLEAVETRPITVERTFADFDDFWTTNMMGPTVGPTVAALSSGEAEKLKNRVRGSLSEDAERRITYSARANAIKGHLPQ